MDSLRSEFLPQQTAKSVEDEAKEQLAQVLNAQKSPLAAIGTLQLEEAALGGVEQSIIAMRTAGNADTDVILAQLLDRRTSLAKRVQELKAGAPSVATQREALAVAKQKLREKASLLDDATAKGEAAAVERAQNRSFLLAEMRNLLDALEEHSEEAVVKLTEAHTTKVKRKRGVLDKAVEACDAKLEKLEEEDFLELEDDTGTTPTEDALQGAVDANRKLSQQVSQLQAAAAAHAAATAATQEAAAAAANRASAESMALDPLDDLELDSALLPTLPPPEQAAVPILERAWYILQMLRYAVNVPISYDALGIPLEDCRQIVGTQWAKVYPAAEPSAADAVPPPVLALISDALDKLGQQFEQRAQAERDRTRLEARDAVTQAKKRLRPQ